MLNLSDNILSSKILYDIFIVYFSVSITTHGSEVWHEFMTAVCRGVIVNMTMGSWKDYYHFSETERTKLMSHRLTFSDDLCDIKDQCDVWF